MNKVGILSLYYKNYNYGGQLQAYAMQYIITKLGYDARQICYVRPKSFLIRKVYVFFKQNISQKKALWGIYQNRIIQKLKKATNQPNIAQTRNNLERFDAFMLSIPHTSVYHTNDICAVCNTFDCLVAGSDQVWNTDQCNYDYFFAFCQPEFPRIAYAASIRKKDFDWFEKKRIGEYLKDFTAISVREEKAVDIIGDITDRLDTKVVLDPVFLLDRGEWLDASKDGSWIGEEYVFVYLIQSYSDERKKKIAQFAGREKMKVFFCSNPGYHPSKADEDFCLITSGVGPSEFLSLVRHAKYVITDSYHCTVFSVIFEKQMLVYGVGNNNATFDGILDDRKYTLLSKLDLLNSSIDLNYDFHDVELHRIDYAGVMPRLEVMRRESLSFLTSSLLKATIASAVAAADKSFGG